MTSVPKKIHVIDARRMVPPEPFERVLDALSTLGEGEKVMLVLHREPLPLYRFLQDNDYRYQVTIGSDGSHEVLIWESAAH
jgi:uncharacterized protein (DUF2249 family)